MPLWGVREGVRELWQNEWDGLTKKVLLDGKLLEAIVIDLKDSSVDSQTATTTEA